jgi:hypothetical protein
MVRFHDELEVGYLNLLSYALGVRNLVNVHHRAGYPKNSEKNK